MTRPSVWMISAFLGSLASGSSLAEGGCLDSMKIVGECRTVHGRLTLANGRTRIWLVGTKRLLAVASREDETPYLPKSAASKLEPDTNEIFGDFNVCPLSDFKPDEMQWVCVRSASSLVSRKRK